MVIHRPIVGAWIRVALTYILLIATHWFIFGSRFLPVNNAGLLIAVACGTLYLIAALLGAGYTHLVEYLWHRFVMHKGFKILAFIKKNHSEHHKALQDEYFRTRDLERLDKIVTTPVTFPVLLMLHYFAWIGIIALVKLSIGLVIPPEYLIAFFTGVTIYYWHYETIHWFVHLENNIVDRLMSKNGTTDRIWKKIVAVHKTHHDHPVSDFNFTPPWIFDRLYKTFRNPK